MIRGIIVFFIEKNSRSSKVTLERVVTRLIPPPTALCVNKNEKNRQSKKLKEKEGTHEEKSNYDGEQDGTEQSATNTANQGDCADSTARLS